MDAFKAKYNELVKKNDPSASKVVFVSSYTTWLRRASTKETLEVDKLTPAERYLYAVDARLSVDSTEDKSTTKAAKAYKKKTVDKPTTIKVSIAKPEYEFDLVVCDEAHALKNEASNTHCLVATIPKRKLLLSSATPSLNHPKDNEGYLRLAFPWFPRVTPIPKDFDLLCLYEDQIDYTKPLCVDGYTDVQGKEQPPVPGQVQLLEPSSTDPLKMSLYEMATRSTNPIKWWRLHPALFHDVARQTGWSFDTTRAIVGAILEHAYIRRTMHTTIEIEPGKMWSPGDSLVGSTTITKSVKLRGISKETYDQLHELYQAMMYVNKAPKTTTTNQESVEVAINMKIWRYLLIAACDPSMSALFSSEAQLEAMEGRVQDIKKRHDINKQINTLKLSQRDDADMADAHGDSLLELEEQLGEIEDADQPIFGVRQVGDMIHNTEDGGSAYLYRQTTGEPDMPAPTDRISMLKYAVGMSPLLAGVALEVLRTVRPARDDKGLPNRVVIFTESPFTQQ